MTPLPLAVRIHQYLATLAPHVREREAAALLAEAEEELDRISEREFTEQAKAAIMSGWIALEDKWPPNGHDYLVAYKSGEYTIIKVAEADGYTECNGVEIPYWKGIMGNGANVTHWMPLPEPPSNS